MRLIDADTLIYHYKHKGEYFLISDELIEDVNAQPTVEKHGHWITNPQYGAECSECGLAMFEIVGVPYTNFKSNYCPNCGAKMDEVEE